MQEYTTKQGGREEVEMKKQGTSDESSSELEVIYDKYTEETKVDKKKKGLFSGYGRNCL